VTDSAGRTVTVPDRIERVFAAGPPASIFLYVLAPEKLLGWPRPPHADEAAFLAEPYRDLPELGRLTGRGDTANIEVVLAAKPDLIFDFGSVAPTYISLADRVQEQTGIPYILIDGTFANTVASLRLLGSILGVGERAEELAKYTEKAFSELDQALTQIPQEKRPKVYFARGPEGLETGVRGSINTEIIERVGAINVADAPGQRGLANISVEQVIVWNPDTIVTLDERFFAGIQKALAQLGAHRVDRREHLDGDGSFQLDVAREIHDAHAAAAELALDDVLAGERILQREEIGAGSGAWHDARSYTGTDPRGIVRFRA
jgi:iron complex transport system substrate-binding protein